MKKQINQPGAGIRPGPINFNQMKYYIKCWETETEREQGNPFKYGPYTDKDECIKDAERMHYSGYAFIEVIDQDNNIYCEYEN
jgi:hypothetical protein